MRNIVAKFGGSSLASAEQILKAAAIIRADSARRCVVVSAPGKRDDDDEKVTDLLYRCHALAEEGGDFETPLGAIERRFAEIVRGLGLNFDLDAEINALRQHLAQAPDRDFMASRGEYLNARIIAEYLGFTFVDPAETVFFNEDGLLNEKKTFRVLGERLESLECAVMPGFYGVMPDGRIRTFSRGGSDITGSIAARAINAQLYENWTDVSGLLTADPRVVENPRVIDYVTYAELRELAYMGASVLHEDAIFPVRQAGIPINIRNTNLPESPGTRIVPSLPAGARRRIITGVAGRVGFSNIVVEKSMMNAEIGFAARLLRIFSENGVSVEHCPTGIDTMSVIVGTEALAPVRGEVLTRIWRELEPEFVSEPDQLAMIAVVGQGMIFSKGTAARVFRALADANINIRMIDQGSSELNIIIGVDEADYEGAIRAIYREMQALM